MKITQTGFVHFSRGCDGSSSFPVFMSDMSEYGYTYLMTTEISFEIPDDFNPVPAEIEALRKMKQKIQADAQISANAIEEQISKLLCLEHVQ